MGDVVASSPGEELVITTLAGDLFVHSLATGVRIYRTWVAGAIGVYNAMALKDLDNDGKKELYVAGSLGIHRFIDPGEHL